MNLLNTKVVLSALGIVAVLASPAFAQKRQHVTHVGQSDVSSVVPGSDVQTIGHSFDHSARWDHSVDLLFGLQSETPENGNNLRVAWRI